MWASPSIPPAEPWLSVITISDGDPLDLQATADSIGRALPDTVEWLVQILAGPAARNAADICAGHTGLVRIEADDGPYDAMNRATSRAAGRYILYLNAGDRLADPALLTAPWPACHPDPFTQVHPAVVMGGAGDRVAGRWRFKRPRSRRWLFWGMPTHHQAILFSRAAIGEKPYNTHYRIAGDYDLLCRLAASGAQFNVTDMNVCLFEGGGLSSIARKRARAEQRHIREVCFRYSDLTQRIITVAQCVVAWTRDALPAVYAVLRYR